MSKEIGQPPTQESELSQKEAEKRDVTLLNENQLRTITTDQEYQAIISSEFWNQGDNEIFLANTHLEFIATVREIASISKPVEDQNENKIQDPLNFSPHSSKPPKTPLVGLIYGHVSDSRNHPCAFGVTNVKALPSSIGLFKPTIFIYNPNLSRSDI